MTALPRGDLVACCIALVVLVGGCASGDKAPSPMTTSTFDQTSADRWHEGRITRLTATDGWLTLVDLAFLTDGVWSFGSDPSCRLHYVHATAPRVGAFVVEGDVVNFAVDLDARGHPAALVTADDRPIDTIALVADDKGSPTVLKNGPITVTLVRRNGALAFRVKDNESPTRTQFAGIERFPFDPTLVVAATVEPAPSGATVSITNVKGFTADEPLVATLRGTVAGVPFAFAATAGGGDRLFVVFGDETNGRETYGGGRFIDIDAPVGGAGDSRVTIDFNRAYNPPCSFTAFATCPTPPVSNRLPVPIRAGERAVH
ncbi:MAG: DUF1684 domain-containing protein [Phycisphaerae bacterium]|nr:DUF1684 domain-containing protein [Phycisphaerae bacterium]